MSYFVLKKGGIELLKKQKQIKLYQILYQSVQSKQIKYDTTKIKLSHLNDKVCLEDVYSYEKVCVQK